MFNIASYLDKFKNIGLKELLLKEKVATTVEKTIHISLKPQDVTIKNGVISLKLSSLEKSELFMKKNRILSIINEGERVKLLDIR